MYFLGFQQLHHCLVPGLGCPPERRPTVITFRIDADLARGEQQPHHRRVSRFGCPRERHPTVSLSKSYRSKATWQPDFKEAEKLLIDKRVDISAQDNTGKTVLHRAVQWQTWRHGGKTIEFLLENGASVFTLDRDGHTPLYTALKHNVSKEISDLLFRWEESVSIRNDNEEPKRTTLQLAVAQNDSEMAALILEKSPQISGFDIQEKEFLIKATIQYGTQDIATKMIRDHSEFLDIAKRRALPSALKYKRSEVLCFSKKVLM